MSRKNTSAKTASSQVSGLVGMLRWTGMSVFLGSVLMGALLFFPGVRDPERQHQPIASGEAVG